MNDDRKAHARFFGKVYNKKKAPDDPRKVVSFDKSEKRADGTWKNIRATAILFEDGTQLDLPPHLTLKPNSGKGTQIYNLYFVEVEEKEDFPF